MFIFFVLGICLISVGMVLVCEYAFTLSIFTDVIFHLLEKSIQLFIQNFLLLYFSSSNPLNHPPVCFFPALRFTLNPKSLILTFFIIDHVIAAKNFRNMPITVHFICIQRSDTNRFFVFGYQFTMIHSLAFAMTLIILLII